jgi:aspartate aminotransferase
VLTATGTGQLSALQQRLERCAARPDAPWLVLVENVPQWPVDGPGGEFPHIPCPDRAGPYSYPHSQGMPVLIDAIVEREGADVVSAREVLVTNGAMHAMALTIRDAARLGYDHAVCLTPMFRSVHELLTAEGFAVSEVPVGTATPPDTNLIRRLCARPGTLLYLNLPHNPTGVTMTADLEQMLRDVLRDSDVTVLYDAVYDSFLFDPAARPTPLGLVADTTRFVVVNSMSKNYGRPGDRIGWILARPDVVERLTADVEREVVAVSAASQLAAAGAIAAGNDVLVDAVRAGREFYRQAAGVGAQRLPAGGTQAWLDLGVADIEQFADFALDTHHLVLTTSSNYFPAPPGYIRFPTGARPSLIRQGMRTLASALDDWAAAR